MVALNHGSPMPVNKSNLMNWKGELIRATKWRKLSGNNVALLVAALMLGVLLPTYKCTQHKFHVEESRRCFFFVQHVNLLRV